MCPPAKLPTAASPSDLKGTYITLITAAFEHRRQDLIHLFDWLPPIRMSAGRLLGVAMYSVAVFQGAFGRTQSRKP